MDANGISEAIIQKYVLENIYIYIYNNTSTTDNIYDKDNNNNIRI